MNIRQSNVASSLALMLILAQVASVVRAQDAAGTPTSPQAKIAAAASVDVPQVERDETGRARVRVERGVRVSVGNRTTGRIVVTGWDRDFIEATATSQNGVEYVSVDAQRDGSSTARILVKADYAREEDRQARRAAALEARHREIEQQRAKLEAWQREVEAHRDSLRNPGASDAPTPAPKPAPTPKAPDETVAPLPSLSSQGTERRFGDIDLEVKVPRTAEIDVIRVIRSEVEVTGVETAITVNGDRSMVRLRQVGAAEVRTRGGRVEVEGVRGLVDVITSSGAIEVRQAGGDVRALSLSGDVTIRCARGRVDVSNTNGTITLGGIGGDVEANTTNSEVRFAGAIRDDGRYHLKSMSGSVEMAVAEDAPGFTALLSSYRGAVKSDFALQFKESTGHDPRAGSGNRLVGRYGNGQAQITLDSFDGSVRLVKLTPGEPRDCK
ncbi:MAG TPA: DUF4097 family beta strand repeat-containing protein [Pyrinomonadaceae bacterium]|nr:DUF4097 family beta strand repeat-containing protein [Pyrinomonadaceae bacterium]